jgi:hypothetical protein
VAVEWESCEGAHSEQRGTSQEEQKRCLGWMWREQIGVNKELGIFEGMWEGEWENLHLCQSLELFSCFANIKCRLYFAGFTVE